MNRTEAPTVGTRVRALTTTRTEQRVVIEVTAVESTEAEGWHVWGYRVTTRRAGRRQTMYPRLYFVAKTDA